MDSLRVLITGGGRGIGRAIALRFAREGAKVIVAARSSPEIDHVVTEIDAAGGHGLAAQMNVRDFGSVEAAVYRATQFTEGVLDVLVNNAGVFEMKPMQEMDVDTWTRHVEVNLTGPFLVTLEALEALRESPRGHVVNISSGAGKQGFPGNTAYCATKCGLRGFSDALRLDLAEDGVKVSTIYPRNTDTALLNGLDWDRSQMNTADEVAEVVWQTVQAREETDVEVPPPARS